MRDLLESFELILEAIQECSDIDRMLAPALAQIAPMPARLDRAKVVLW